MELTQGRQVNFKEHVRSSIDRRVFVDYYTVEYLGEDNAPYRKAFEVKPGNKPSLPLEGNHVSLNALKKQW